MEFEPNPIAQKILESTGLETRQVGTDLYYHESAKLGAVLIHVFSDAQFEEDIAQMPKERTVLTPSEHIEILQHAFEDTLKMIGAALPQHRLERYFPNLSLDSIDEYNFKDSKIKVFVLSSNDYEKLFKEHEQDENIRHSAVSVADVVPHTDTLGPRELEVNLSDIKVEVISEVDPHMKHLVPDAKDLDVSAISPETKKLIAENIKSRAIHELLHDLGVAIGLKDELREGITEWYAHQIADGELTDENFYEDKGSLMGYYLETGGVSVILNALMEAGVSIDVLDKAFVSNKTSARNTVFDALRDRYGIDNVKRLITWDFDNVQEAFDFICDLEEDKGSNIGNFVKEYRHSGKSFK
jgi:hypothetical protein